jgi:hypothetical protein
VGPAAVHQETAENGTDEAVASERVARALGVKRFGTPGEVARIVAFLSSPQAGFGQGTIVDVGGSDTHFEGDGGCPLSQIMEFYSGDADEIVRSNNTGGLGAIRGAPAHPVMAGFYNISLTDLDILTGQACLLLGEEPIDFVGSLVEVPDWGPGDGRYVVSPRWVELLAGISDGSVELLARRWMTALAEEHPTNASDEGELGKGLHDLIEGCRIAVDHGEDVLFVWT